MDKITITRDDARFVFVEYLLVRLIIIVLLIVSLTLPPLFIKTLSIIALASSIYNIYQVKKILIDEKLLDLGKWAVRNLWRRRSE